MQQILKRLEIIKSSIPLEDIEIIELQVLKLQKLKIDDDVQSILDHIENENFAPVISLITDYINRFSGLQLYSDPRIQGLRVELKILEKEFLKLSNQKSEIEQLISEFNHQYMIRLGELISQLLKLKAEKERSKEKIEEEFKNFKEEFEKEQEKEKSKKTVTLDEKRELKKLYREASKLCHPDVVLEENREVAEEVFKELNEAYSNNDLEKVSKILNSLKNGGFETNSEKIDNFEILKSKIDELREKIDSEKRAISELKNSEIYQKIEIIDDWEDYFLEVENSLKEELKNY